MKDKLIGPGSLKELVKAYENAKLENGQGCLWKANGPMMPKKK